MMQQVKMRPFVFGVTHLAIIAILNHIYCFDYSEVQLDDQPDHDEAYSKPFEGQDRLLLHGLLHNHRPHGKLIGGCPRIFESIFDIRQADILFVSPTTRQDVVIDIANTGGSTAAENLIRSGFSLTQQTVLYTHGWMETGQSGWLQRVRSQYWLIFQYKRPTFNLLIFDWSEVAAKRYGRAARKSPNLGGILYKFFDALHARYNYQMSNVHLVGYSMSAHIIGTAGRLLSRMGKRIRQITAIDPAGPCFFTGKKFARRHSLTSDVADLVVALHYSYSSARPIGGVDIFVNGGDEQSLSGTNWMGSGLNNLGAASHQSSSLVTAGECFGVAYECDNHDKFLSGACAICSDQRGQRCYVLETLSKGAYRYKDGHFGPGTTMYVQISGRQSCLYHYQVMAILIRNASLTTAQAFESGSVAIDLSKGYVRPSRYYNCEGMKAYTTLFTSEESLNLDYVFIDPNVVRVSDVAAVKINYMSNPLEEYRDQMSYTMCPGEDYLTEAACSKEIFEKVC